jgi:hypothetical protein
MAKKDKDRGPDLMSKYVWLINTIYRTKRISYNDINERWKRDVGMSSGEDLPKRTLKRWLNIIEALFGIDIINEKCGEYRYYIENIEGIDEGGLQSWLFKTFTVSNALTGCMSIKDRIQLEYVPSGELYLQPIIDAMKENRVINLTYKSYWKDRESNYDVQPLCLKLFRQRWYVIVRRHCADGDGNVWICGLDRILSLEKTEETFTMPKDWDAESYFDGYIGVIRDEDYDKEMVKIKMTADQANYLRDLKIHRSQLEVERNSEYSIFTYFLRPTFDFQQELLWNADRVEVLEPQWLRDEMAGLIKRMSRLYRN